MDVTQLIFGEANPLESSTPFLIAVVVATSMVVISTRRRMQRTRRERVPRSSRKLNPHSAMVHKRAESIRTQNSAESEANAAMLELQDYSRQVQAQIDNRFQKLEAATRHADNKIAELRELLQQAGAEAKPLTDPPASGDPVDKPDPITSR